MPYTPAEAPEEEGSWPTPLRPTIQAGTQTSTDALLYAERPGRPACCWKTCSAGRLILAREEWEADRPRPGRQKRLSDGKATRCSTFSSSTSCLTNYEAGRIRSGKTSGLLLGNYRILDRLGSGGMGVCVYKAEHRMELRRPVALKVLPCPTEDDPQVLDRFLAEIRRVAGLKHPEHPARCP